MTGWGMSAHEQSLMISTRVRPVYSSYRFTLPSASNSIAFCHGFKLEVTDERSTDYSATPSLLLELYV